jgi:septum formation protein
LALILASSSSIRRTMLKNAAVEHRIVPASIDEEAIKAGLAGAGDVPHELAKAKAIAGSREHPDDWVIGSDSVVTVGDRLFDKPRDRTQAAEHLRFFSGKPMRLTSAVALARGGTVDWSHSESAILHVHELSDRFIESYLEAEWPEVGYCVGVFRLEGPGVQLFERIEGDYFTILGMPLLPLLAALRARGILAA